MSYKLNPNGPYKQNSGAAITEKSTNIDFGAAQHIQEAANLNKVDGTPRPMESPNVVGGNGVAAADYQISMTTGGAGNSPGNNAGNIQFIWNDPVSVQVGELLRIDPQDGFDGGEYRVISIEGSTIFTVNANWKDSYYDIQNWQMYKVKGTFATQAEGNYMMKKMAATVHGTEPSKLVTGAADYGRRKVAKMPDSIKTLKVATALRQGKFDTVSGQWAEGYPQLVTDSFNPDEEAAENQNKTALKGEYVFRNGTPTPQASDYDQKKG